VLIDGSEGVSKDTEMTRKANSSVAGMLGCGMRGNARRSYDHYIGKIIKNQMVVFARRIFQTDFARYEKP
jgi:hypothetical protein